MPTVEFYPGLSQIQNRDLTITQPFLNTCSLEHSITKSRSRISIFLYIANIVVNFIELNVIKFYALTMGVKIPVSRRAQLKGNFIVHKKLWTVRMSKAIQWSHLTSNATGKIPAHLVTNLWRIHDSCNDFSKGFSLFYQVFCGLSCLKSRWNNQMDKALPNG